MIARRANATNPPIAIALCLCSTLLWASDREHYDGKWWISLKKELRLSFVDGYIVCYQNMVNAKEFDEDIRLYRDRINAYLTEHPESARESVSDLMSRMAHPPYSRPPAKHAAGGETYPGRWGLYNGDDYWQLGTDEEHLTFIQGFLDCYDKHTNHPNGTFSKPLEWYVKAIDDWYGYGPNVPVIKSRVNDGIPDVLFHFHD